MPVNGSINFSIQYEVDGEELEFDTARYFNAANNRFSVSKLEYYISNLTLIGDDGELFASNDIHLINARNESAIAFSVLNIPVKNYSGISFNIGLIPKQNKSGSLPPTLENRNMAWPEPMGGGYHFLKLEGHVIDSIGTRSGYAMHLGTDTCLIHLTLKRLMVVQYQNQRMNLTMNVNEWFSNPNVYDLSVNNYNMGNQGRMLEIAQNGASTLTLN